MKKPELLVPAGSLQDLEVAVNCGADAVYLGGGRFNLRAKIPNLTIEDIQKGVEYAHDRGVRVYVTVNIAAHNEDLGEMPTFLRKLEQMRVDAVIIWDPGVILLAQELVPGIAIPSVPMKVRHLPLEKLV